MRMTCTGWSLSQAFQIRHGRPEECKGSDGLRVLIQVAETDHASHERVCRKAPNDYEYAAHAKEGCKFCGRGWDESHLGVH